MSALLVGIRVFPVVLLADSYLGWSLWEHIIFILFVATAVTNESVHFWVLLMYVFDSSTKEVRAPNLGCVQSNGLSLGADVAQIVVQVRAQVRAAIEGRCISVRVILRALRRSYIFLYCVLGPCCCSLFSQ